MMFGHLVLGVEALPFFYSGLVLLACGSGLLKPNVSTLVGNLYRDRPELRDQGFNIFYMGINLGAFISPLTVSWLRTALRLGPGVHVGGRRDAAVARRLHHVQPLRGGRGRQGRTRIDAEEPRRSAPRTRDRA